MRAVDHLSPWKLPIVTLAIAVVTLRMGRIGDEKDRNTQIPSSLLPRTFNFNTKIYVDMRCGDDRQTCMPNKIASRILAVFWEVLQEAIGWQAFCGYITYCMHRKPRARRHFSCSGVGYMPNLDTPMSLLILIVRAVPSLFCLSNRRCVVH